MKKIRITKKDIDAMSRDELEIFLSDCEDGIYADYHKFNLEDGIYSYAVDKMFRFDFE